jgi:predicted nucleic acid-binding Zn ribbon protein
MIATLPIVEPEPVAAPPRRLCLLCAKQEVARDERLCSTCATIMATTPR